MSVLLSVPMFLMETEETIIFQWLMVSSRIAKPLTSLCFVFVSAAACTHRRRAAPSDSCIALRIATTLTNAQVGAGGGASGGRVVECAENTVLLISLSQEKQNEGKKKAC
jgi:hypothetical protein